MKDRDIMQCVEAKIEIGHRASLRAEPTKEGCTHDWTVYIKGQEGSIIAHFVEKVVFHLHHTFANPRRVVKEPPYYVSEVGYAGFNLPIEICFKSKKEPRLIKFNYYLLLNQNESVSYVRCEKLTFVNPTDDFKEKLIKAEEVLVLPPGETQFEDLCASPLKPESPKKHLQPFTSKENVSKEMLNFSGDEKPSSSGKHISASLNSTAKQVKIDNKSKAMMLLIHRLPPLLPPSPKKRFRKPKVQGKSTHLKNQIIHPKWCLIHLLCHPKRDHLILRYAAKRTKRSPVKVLLCHLRVSGVKINKGLKIKKTKL